MTRARTLRSMFGLGFMLAALGWGSMASGGDGSADKPVAAVDFNRDIKPLLAKRCFSCHGPDKAESGLRLHERDTALAKLDSDARAIVPGKPGDSELLARVSSDDESVRMPPEGKPLSAAQIDRIRRWISQGAEWPRHWGFVQPGPQTPPGVRRRDWVRNPIDAFILHRLEANGLAPAAPAEKTALLRRVYYDLTGLPPAPEDVQAFLADDTADAFEKVVDRLLDSPRYGEHWARRWLDLVRFAETNSYERDGVKPNAWKYRDYVIRSFNADKPYDQFIREQLAGDEFEQVTPESVTATGYYRLGVWDDEPADPLQARYDELDDIITTTSQVFLGLTVNCARCHDHKIDPIPQTDYYRLQAFFHGLTSYGTRGNQRDNNQVDVSPPELVASYARIDRELARLRSQTRAVEQRGVVKMSAEDQRKSETRQREQLLRDKLRDYLSDDDWRQYRELKSALDNTVEEQKRLPPRETVLGVAKCAARPETTHVLLRGNPHARGQEVQPGFPQLFAAADPVIPTAGAGAHSSGRRLALANWIASPDNLLTSRVMVNRVWQQLFGRGIVRSANNFGGLGTPPTHPQLLAWLAEQFVSAGWRLKPLQKLILMSNTYRMSSRGAADGLAADPENNLFWRFDMRRLSAEEIRDSVHAVSGRLNLKMYGPGMYPDISDEVKAGQSRPGAGWGRSSPEEQARRSVYIHVKRSLITPLLANFDFPETDSSCEARFVTTQPSQALGMINGRFLHRQAGQFAERLRSDAGAKSGDQVRRALWLALCRPPRDEEIAAGVDLIQRLEEQHGVEAEQALTYFCLVTLNLNEFLYLD